MTVKNTKSFLYDVGGLKYQVFVDVVILVDLGLESLLLGVCGCPGGSKFLYIGILGFPGEPTHR